MLQKQMVQKYKRCILYFSAFCFSISALAELLPPIRLVSADFRPLSIENHKEAPGAMIELAEAMLSKVGSASAAEFYPWARSIALMEKQPRVAIAPFARTPDREQKYQWLVKLYKQDSRFITPSDKPAVASLEAARKLKVVVLRASPNLAELIKHGFNKANIIEESSVENTLKALDRGLVDAVYGIEAIYVSATNVGGRRAADYNVGMSLSSKEIWLAGGSGFTEADKVALQDAFDTLVNDGSYRRILKKYQFAE